MKLQILFAILSAFALSAESEYIDGSYIIQLKDGSTEAHIEEVIQKIEGHTLSSREDMEIISISSVLPIVFGKFDKETAEMVSGLESVELVEQDQVVTIDMPYENPEEISTDDDTDSDKSGYSDLDSDSQEVDEMEMYNSTEESNLEAWRFHVPHRYNLDIIDNTHCVDGYFTPVSYGKGVDIYILDTGINYHHDDFRYTNGKGNRAFYGGFDIHPSNQGWDQQGHGTHCAGIAGGRYSGVAKDAMLYSIRVINSNNEVSHSNAIKGMDHAYYRHSTRVGKQGFRGSVMSMSLRFPYTSKSMNNVVNGIVGRGVTIVTASGNDGKDACSYSPGSAGLNINVGAHWYIYKGCKKPMYSRSNYGRCVHIVAPGVNVLSANYRSNYGYKRLTGTSMACPHVAGTAALMLQERRYNPAQIKYQIQRYAINDLSNRQDSTHRLYVTSRLWS